MGNLIIHNFSFKQSVEQSTETKLTLISTQDQLSQANAQNLELQSNLQKSDIDSSSLYVRLQEQVNFKLILKFPKKDETF